MNGELSNLEFYATPEGVVLDFDLLGVLRSNGYPLDGVKELHTVKRKQSERAHLVLQVETTTKPKDDPELDIVADRTQIWLCDCRDYLFNQMPDLSEFNNDPSDAGTCVHIDQVSKVARAKSDNDQRELGE
jgi:hypothetical protein